MYRSTYPFPSGNCFLRLWWLFLYTFLDDTVTTTTTTITTPRCPRWMMIRDWGITSLPQVHHMTGWEVVPETVHSPLESTTRQPGLCRIRDLYSKTAEDGDGNIGKTITLLIQEDKKCVWICEIKADICAVLLSNETSTASFPLCLQKMANISRTNFHHFVQEML